MSTIWLSLLLPHILVLIIARYTKTDPFDYYEPKRWRSFSIWIAKLYLRYQGETNTYLSRVQIFNYGMRFAHCYDCVLAGKCVKCGCDIEGRMNNMTDECANLKFGEGLTDEEFNESIEDIKNNLQISIKE